jgi:hypothetical protein
MATKKDQGYRPGNVLKKRNIAHLHNLWLLLEVRMKVCIALRNHHMLAKLKSRVVPKKIELLANTYLARIHLKLAHDFDGYFSCSALDIPCLVDITESSIAHLLDELPSLQTGISW